jgi:hypothetical protein
MARNTAKTADFRRFSLVFRGYFGRAVPKLGCFASFPRLPAGRLPRR